MTCVECDAEIGASRLCQQCGAQAAEHPEPRRPASGQPTTRVPTSRLRGVLAFVAYFVLTVVNIIALVIAIVFPVGFATQGTPAEAGQLNYIPLGEMLATTIVCASVPILTAVFLFRRLKRRTRQRRSLASGAPALETLD